MSENRALDIAHLRDGVIMLESKKTFLIDKFAEISRSYFLSRDLFRNFSIYLCSRLSTESADISPEQLSQDGIPCSILSPITQGWQSGRLKMSVQIKLEFCPDNPDFTLPSPEEQAKVSTSTLDDLRDLAT